MHSLVFIVQGLSEADVRARFARLVALLTPFNHRVGGEWVTCAHQHLYAKDALLRGCRAGRWRQALCVEAEGEQQPGPGGGRLVLPNCYSRRIWWCGARACQPGPRA